jgi:hypothetical protein
MLEPAMTLVVPRMRTEGLERLLPVMTAEGPGKPVPGSFVGGLKKRSGEPERPVPGSSVGGLKRLVGELGKPEPAMTVVERRKLGPVMPPVELKMQPGGRMRLVPESSAGARKRLVPAMTVVERRKPAPEGAAVGLGRRPGAPEKPAPVSSVA